VSYSFVDFLAFKKELVATTTAFYAMTWLVVTIEASNIDFGWHSLFSSFAKIAFK